MAAELDHLILRVNDPQQSIDFHTRILGEAGMEYGDSFHTVGNKEGPGEEDGARGPGKALYLFDPNKHLIEIRYYES